LAGALAVGQPVRIKRGQLRGLSGTLVRFKNDGNCLVELDGLHAGILLSIASRSLEGALAALPIGEQGNE
jgi:hypothetical protein